LSVACKQKVATSFEMTTANLYRKMIDFQRIAKRLIRLNIKRIKRTVIRIKRS